MPDDLKNKGATGEDSPSSDKGGANKGTSLPPEEMQAELERKTKEIEKLKTDYATTRARVEELEKLQDQDNLTPDEEEELAKEKEKVKKIADKIKQSREYAPWEILIREQASGSALEIILNNEIIKANDLIEDFAVDEGLVKDGVTLKVATEKMAKLIAPFIKNYSDKSPSRRNQLAYRDWKAEQKRLGNLDERERKLKEREDEAQRFRETGFRVSRDKSVDTKLKEATTGKEKAALLKDLVATAAVGEE